ncbi:MAG: hypothetical protein EOL97_08630 [Spirochaetia bacterium]|nr:hypothetical protein [Spirochaetia bacterium]
MNKKYWVYDLETIVNCFIAVFESLVDKERHIFIIHETQNDTEKLIKFLENDIINNNWHLGYNNLAFDSQLIEYILDHKDLLLNQIAADTAQDLYHYAQHVIDLSNSNQFLDYAPFKLRLKNVDIYKLNYWDSSVKRSSLKWIQYSMDWENVEEMPHDFREPVNTKEELEVVVSYCINDVSSTKAVYNFKDKKGEQVMISQINLRGQLSKEFKLGLHSAAEPKIAKDVFLHFLSKKMNINKKELSLKRTYRDFVKLKDVILPYITFKNEKFIGVKKWFESLTIDTAVLKEEEEKTKGPKNVKTINTAEFTYGLGGVHACAKSGVYKSENGRVIKSCDVKSFYPNMAIKNGWHPAHIPSKIFCEQYEWFYNERLKYPKTSPLNYLFKIVLNSSYGLSKQKHCFLYDPRMTLQICINGELLLSMLIDWLITEIPTIEILMANTDGFEVRIDKKDESVYNRLCSEWESLTNLELEFVDYAKMIVGDVNVSVLTL